MIGSFSKILLISGALIFGLGVLLAIGSKWGLGGLPGDLMWQKGNTSIYFPIVTSLVISLLLTLVLNIVVRLIR